MSSFSLIALILVLIAALTFIPAFRRKSVSVFLTVVMVAGYGSLLLIRAFVLYPLVVILLPVYFVFGGILPHIFLSVAGRHTPLSTVSKQTKYYFFFYTREWLMTGQNMLPSWNMILFAAFVALPTFYILWMWGFVHCNDLFGSMGFAPLVLRFSNLGFNLVVNMMLPLDLMWYGIPMVAAIIIPLKAYSRFRNVSMPAVPPVIKWAKPNRKKYSAPKKPAVVRAKKIKTPKSPTITEPVYPPMPAQNGFVVPAGASVWLDNGRLVVSMPVNNNTSANGA